LIGALPGASCIGALVAGQAGLVRWQHSGQPVAAAESGFSHFG
jgi:hypothetical protein